MEFVRQPQQTNTQPLGEKAFLCSFQLLQLAWLVAFLVPRPMATEGQVHLTQTSLLPPSVTFKDFCDYIVATCFHLKVNDYQPQFHMQS